MCRRPLAGDNSDRLLHHRRSCESRSNQIVARAFPRMLARQRLCLRLADHPSAISNRSLLKLHASSTLLLFRNISTALERAHPSADRLLLTILQTQPHQGQHAHGYGGPHGSRARSWLPRAHRHAADPAHQGGQCFANQACTQNCRKE